MSAVSSSIAATRLVTENTRSYHVHIYRDPFQRSALCRVPSLGSYSLLLAFACDRHTKRRRALRASAAAKPRTSCAAPYAGEPPGFLLSPTSQTSPLLPRDSDLWRLQPPPFRHVQFTRKQLNTCAHPPLLNSPNRPHSPPCPTAPLSSLSDPKPRNYGEVATTVENRSSAKDALQKSCYFKIDFGISEDATVYEAVQRFAAYNIGALAVTNADKRVIGIVSERDYVSKVREKGDGCAVCMMRSISFCWWGRWRSLCGCV